MVTKSYCDSNSKNSDGTGVITGLIGGGIGAFIGSALTTSLGSGLSALGGITGSLVGGTGLFVSGLVVGSGSDLLTKPIAPGESEQLIDNVADDIANGGSASGDQN